MRIAFNEKAFRAVAANVADLGDLDQGQPVTATSPLRRGLHMDDQLRLRSTFTEVVNETVDGVQVFTLDGPPAGATSVSASVYLEPVYDRDGGFGGLEFQATLMWRCPNFQMLTFSEVDDSLDIDDIGGDQGPFLNQVVSLTERTVAALNQRIESAQEAWTTVLVSTASTGA